MNHKIFYIFDQFLKIFPILRLDHNSVMLSSFNGLYNDSPRYISEELHSICPTINLYWIIGERANTDDIPDYVIIVKQWSLRHLSVKHKCKVIVDNYLGEGGKFINPMMYRIYRLLNKKRKQYLISTWHGTPLKKLGKDELNIRRKIYHKIFYSKSDLISFNSDYMTQIFKNAFSERLSIKNYGTPRNDPLFIREAGAHDHLYYKLGLDKNYKYVLYAPTYRNVNGKIGVVSTAYISEEEVIALIEALKNRFGGEWRFIFRVHQFVELNNISNKSYIINGNLHDDMADYLTIADVLITDYSGSLFDFTITGRPCFIYAPDYKDYSEKYRGTYLSLQDLPYDYAFTIDELVKIIMRYDHIKTDNRVKKFNKNINMIDDGAASYRISCIILNKLNCN